MAADTAGVDRALGAIGTTFRLMRLYPPSHPAVAEALRQIGEALPALAALGTVEWKVGVTGLHWHGQHLLPRNAQIAELAGLLYARGVRAVTLNPGMAPEHVLALFHVATGTVPPDDGTLGRITLTLGRRTSARLERLRTPTPASGAPAIPEPSAESSPPTAVTTEQSTAAAAGALMAGKRASAAFRPDELPVDVEVKRAVTALGNAATTEEQAAAVDKLAALAPQLLGLHDVAIVADAIAALDRLLPTANDAKVVQAIDQAAVALSGRGLVERLVHRLGEARVPPEEREAVVTAVAALASLSMGLVLDAFIAAPVDLRAPYREAVRKAADRALEPLQGKLADPDAQVVAAAAEFVGLTGSPQAVALLIPLLRHASEFVREAAPARLGEPEQRRFPHEFRCMPQQRNQQRHRLRAPRQTHELGRRRHHLGIRVRQFALQWVEGPDRRLAHRSPVRGPQVHGRRDERVQDEPHGQRRQRGHGRHDRLALLGGHARLPEPVHQALDQATLRERDRRLVDRLHDLRIVCRRQQAVERRDRIRHDGDVVQPQQLGGERSELVDRGGLLLGRGGVAERGHGPLHFHIDRQHVGPERGTGSFSGHQRAGRRGGRLLRRDGGRGTRFGRRLRDRRRTRRRRRRAQSLEPGGGAASQRQSDTTERPIVGRDGAGGHVEQRQHVLGRHARIEGHRPHAARVQQAGELGNLCVAGQQVLAVPVQAGDAYLPLHGTQRGDARDRLAGYRGVEGR